MVLNTNKAAVLSAGVIGYSFALKAALGGYEVWAQNRSETSKEQTIARTEESLRSLRDNHVLDTAASDAAFRRIHFTTSLEEACTDAGYIQECSSENYAVKQALMGEVERYAPIDTVIASSTSGLLMTEIARYALHPERMIVGHPWNPPHLIPLIELVGGEKTEAWALERGKRFYTDIGMEPVILKKEVPGFIANRLQIALYRECAHLVMNGVCSVEDVDRALTFGPGIRWGIMGQNLIYELGGGDGGVEGLVHHIGPSFALWLRDMADFKAFPEEWGAIAEAGVQDELKNRSEAIGNDRRSLAAYRDRMLIELLRLHGKL